MESSQSARKSLCLFVTLSDPSPLFFLKSIGTKSPSSNAAMLLERSDFACATIALVFRSLAWNCRSFEPGPKCEG